MSEDAYNIEPTSRDSANCDPFVLRQTETRRLVFIPQLVNSVRDKNAAIKGIFAYQRKGRNDVWENVQGINLATLKNGEGVRLDLNTDEVLKLFGDLEGLYKLHLEAGIPRRQTIYLKTDVLDTGSLEINAEQIQAIFSKIQESGANVLNQALDWVLGLDNPQSTVQQLQLLDVDDLQKLNALAAASSLRKVLRIWTENRTNSDEEFWQQTLSEYSFTISQIFSSPIVILAEKAYLGGKGINNQGGNIVDYIVQNNLTKNTALVEIKTPVTSLLGRMYREGTYAPSPELSGAITQTLTYKDFFVKESGRLRDQSRTKFQVTDPSCLLVVGNSEELDTVEKQRSFELFRAGMRNLNIITYDEFFAKIETLAALIEGND